MRTAWPWWSGAELARSAPTMIWWRQMGTMPDSGAHGRSEPRYRANVPKVTAREFFKSALSLRMIALFLGLVVVAGVCIRLGSWQLDRASERANQQAAAQAAADADSAPQPLESVLQPGETFIGAVENQRISVRGEYEPEGQLLVPERILDGVAGYGVITPLRVGEAVLPVLRGWIADPGDLSDPPTGEVEITGVLRPSEGMNPESLPPGQVPRISSADLVKIGRASCRERGERAAGDRSGREGRV